MGYGVLFFKSEEEVKAALLLQLLKLFAGGCVFGSAFGLGCLLVEAFSTYSVKNNIAGFCCFAATPYPL
jgi:hypothetical protein